MRQRVFAIAALLCLLTGLAAGQDRPSAVQVDLPSDYVIGAGDVLSIEVWRDKDLSQEVVVRPDGKISLPLLNDVVAAGQTPEQLRRRLTDAAKRFYTEEPVFTVIVKQINSTKVFITGKVAHPGAYTLTSPTTVLQLLAMAGGFADFANANKILIARVENGAARSYFFNYDEALKGKLAQNILLKSGDTIVVP